MPNPASTTGRSSDHRIIEAALTLIAERGLGGITMSAIAETAGVARQTLYNHYSDVDSIVAAAISRHHRESIELLEASLRVVDLPEEKLEQLVRHVVSISVHAHHASGIQHGLSPDTRVVLSDYEDAVTSRIRAILQQGQSEGAFRRDLVPDIDAALVRHMLDGIAELAARDPAGAARLVAAATRSLVAAVAAR